MGFWESLANKHSRVLIPSSRRPSQEKLGPQCIKSLEDQVASIREATAKTLQKIAQEFGADWAKDHLVPQVRVHAWWG